MLWCLEMSVDIGLRRCVLLYFRLAFSVVAVSQPILTRWILEKLSPPRLANRSERLECKALWH